MQRAGEGVCVFKAGEALVGIFRITFKRTKNPGRAALTRTIRDRAVDEKRLASNS
jgi:hypothetical protein